MTPRVDDSLLILNYSHKIGYYFLLGNRKSISHARWKMKIKPKFSKSSTYHCAMIDMRENYKTKKLHVSCKKY